MKKSLRILLSLTLALCLAAAPAAAGDAGFAALQTALGIQADAAHANLSLAGIAEGDVIRAVVTDPSKIGGCSAGDPLELFFMGDGKWMIKHVSSGSAVDIVTVESDGTLEVARTGTYRRVDEAGDAPSAPAPYDGGRRLTAAFKAGAYVPDDDLDDFDTGFAAEFAVSRYLSPYFALEATVGYFQTSGDLKGGVNGAPVLADTDVWAIPVTANCKGVLPFKNGEAYLGGDVGFYYARGEMDITIADKKYTASDNDYIFGAQLLAGFNVNLNDRVFIGAEGKHVFTGDVDLIDRLSSAPAYVETEFNLNGFTVTGQFGYRF